MRPNPQSAYPLLAAPSLLLCDLRFASQTSLTSSALLAVLTGVYKFRREISDTTGAYKATELGTSR